MIDFKKILEASPEERDHRLRSVQVRIVRNSFKSVKCNLDLYNLCIGLLHVYPEMKQTVGDIEEFSVYPKSLEFDTRFAKLVQDTLEECEKKVSEEKERIENK